jgi:hypothetical protein
MSKAQKDAVKIMKPSAYRSMQLGKLGMNKSTPSKKKDLLRWGSSTEGEEWLNLNALKDKKIKLPCGTKYKGQIEPTVCRPSKKISERTPKPLAKDLSFKQIQKAIEIKKLGMRVNWSQL